MKANKGDLVILTLMTGDAIMGTVARSYSDGGYELDKVKYVSLGDSGEIFLDKYQSFSATENFTFPPHAILTANTPIPELIQFYTTKEQDGTPQTMLVEASSNSVH